MLFSTQSKKELDHLISQRAEPAPAKPPPTERVDIAALKARVQGQNKLVLSVGLDNMSQPCLNADAQSQLESQALKDATSQAIFMPKFVDTQVSLSDTNSLMAFVQSQPVKEQKLKAISESRNESEVSVKKWAKRDKYAEELQTSQNYSMLKVDLNSHHNSANLSSKQVITLSDNQPEKSSQPAEPSEIKLSTKKFSANEQITPAPKKSKE